MIILQNTFIITSQFKNVNEEKAMEIERGNKAVYVTQCEHA